MLYYDTGCQKANKKADDHFYSKHSSGSVPAVTKEVLIVRCRYVSNSETLYVLTIEYVLTRVSFLRKFGATIMSRVE
eukprot:TRINITY_DN1_c0_g2_i2.p1 TRINITY_DN1_c0_g2~~TRINITY_DN1_c0_g2_i2.p1  ORF type:complete len:77 (+),score=9.19 TRINITY_DN1_c0_g2_i2:34-264(+)